MNEIHEFVTTLLGWFRENGRELPWRGTKDPYAIWLSEIILQQTQVRQGWDYWQRFMRRWPTVEALAAATEDEVLREWQGLGYYSRARNLHAAARQVVAMGAFPTTVEGLRSLKGVGDYTAAAIGSIAYGLPVAVVDGNVYRVLSRHFGISSPIDTTAGKHTFTALAQSLVDSLKSTRDTSNYSLYNQAIMDFGALQCTPQRPDCDGCPLQPTCVAQREGRVAELPLKQGRLTVRERRLTYIYIRCQHMTALHRRGAGDIWQGLWEPFLVEQEHKGALAPKKTADAFGSLAPFSALLTPLKTNVKHVLTHQILYADFWLLDIEERPVLPADYVWVSEDDVGDYGVPRLIEKMLDEINNRQ